MGKERGVPTVLTRRRLWRASWTTPAYVAGEKHDDSRFGMYSCWATKCHNKENSRTVELSLRTYDVILSHVNAYRSNFGAMA